MITCNNKHELTFPLAFKNDILHTQEISDNLKQITIQVFCNLCVENLNQHGYFTLDKKHYFGLICCKILECKNPITQHCQQGAHSYNDKGTPPMFCNKHAKRHQKYMNGENSTKNHSMIDIDNSIFKP